MMKVFTLINDINESSLELDSVTQAHILKIKKKIALLVNNIGQLKWDLKTRWFEPAKCILENVRGKHSIPLDASNAFLKMIELFSILPQQIYINHFDNASLPGDFIRAIEWVSNKKKFKYDWTACSLIDPNQNSLCDRFNLLKENPSKWLMTESMNGDITEPENQDYIISCLKDRKINLYTSDVGMPIEDKFNEEREHLAANISQVYIGMSILEAGGSMIVKCFSLCLPKNITLINILIDSFKEVKIMKPYTSKTDNSEMYIICIGYSSNQSRIAKVKNLLVKEPTLNESIPPASLLQCKAIIGGQQVTKLEKNIEWFQQNAHPDFTEYSKQWKMMFL